MPETRKTRDLKNTSIHDHLLNRMDELHHTTELSPQTTEIDRKQALEGQRGQNTNKETLTQQTDNHHEWNKQSEGLIKTILADTEIRHRLSRISTPNDYQSPSRATGGQNISENAWTFSGEKNDDAGEWLDHICEIIEKQEVLPEQQRDVAARRLRGHALWWYRLNRLKMPDMQSFVQQFLDRYHAGRNKATTEDTKTNEVNYRYELREEQILEKESEVSYDNRSKSITEKNHDQETKSTPVSSYQVLQSARNEKAKLFPNFSGTENSMNWLKSLQQIGKSLRLNEEQKYELAVIKLNGPAQEWFYQQEEEIDNWTKFKQALLYAFPPPIQSTNIEHLAQLLARRQGENEPVGKYVQEVNRLCLKLENKLSEQDKLQYLRRGLRPHLQHHALEITSVHEFLTIMQRHEQIDKEGAANRQLSIHNGRTESGLKEDGDKQTNRIYKTHQHTRELERNEPSEKRGGEDTNGERNKQHHGNDRMRCYVCNEPGHMRWNCPTNNTIPMYQQPYQHFQQRGH